MRRSARSSTIRVLKSWLRALRPLSANPPPSPSPPPRQESPPDRGETATKPAALPEWNLAISMRRSTRRRSPATSTSSMPNARAFEAAYKGRIADETAKPEAARACGRRAALRGDRRSRRPARLLCRPRPCRQHVDPVTSKFYGDISERITAASVHLLFFALELNRVDDAVIARALETPSRRPLPAVDRGPAQGQALSARGPRRAAVPEKSVTAYGAGTGSSTRPSRRCASRSRARSLPSSRR